MLTVYSLEIVAEAVTPLSFDEMCGSALRGALFQALWSRFCNNFEAPTCKVCPLATSCPVAALVAPAREEKSAIPGFGEDVLRPYTVRAPLKPEGKQYHRYEPGETFTFGITLLGTSGKLFPFVLRGLQEMEQQGLGRPVRELQGQRGRWRLREVRASHSWTTQRQVLWRREEPQERRLILGVTGDEVAAHARQLSPREVTLHFVSPMRLIADKQVLTRPAFAPLLLRLAERVEQLHSLYGIGPSTQPLGKEWYLRVGTEAGAVRLLRDETSWARVTSHSARQQRTMPIDGFVGRASFQGDLTNLRELLVWGELIGVGKSVTKGCGHYHIEHAGAEQESLPKEEAEGQREHTGVQTIVFAGDSCSVKGVRPERDGQDV